MDFIGQIYLASSKGHTFIIVATDYFTKWVKASAVKSITSAAVKNFIETKILYRFGVPETIVTGHLLFQKKLKSLQANSSEKWHEKLGNTLWAYRTSKRAGTGATPYALNLRQDAVLPMEINEGKKVVARAYNKKVKIKSFKEEDLVWKTVIPLGAQLRGFGKWSPTWECPFTISRVLDKGGYYLADLEGNWQKHPINVKFLKRYCPTLWDVRDCYIEEGARFNSDVLRLIPSGCNVIFSWFSDVFMDRIRSGDREYQEVVQESREDQETLGGVDLNQKIQIPRTRVQTHAAIQLILALGIQG
ncbi:uncharacterized protein [Malus domestica]|uniref:uncharacterized protein n=1 Tax=Malus domestica TaxID=3750 RepID=UPI0039748F63